MININTMDKLEKLHIGSDVDKLENYMALINYSELMGNCIVNKDEKIKIIELLEEIKKNSELFKYTWDMEKSEIDEFDRHYTNYGKFAGVGINHIDEFNSLLDEEKDIFAYALPDGIDIRIVYRKGIFYKAYTYYKSTKGLDITKHIKHLVPYNLQEIENTGLLELQARITMTDEQMKNADIIEENKLYFIVNYLSTEYCEKDIDKFSVIVYKMYCDDEESDTKTMWSEYKLLEETELDLAYHALLREIDRYNVNEALYEFSKYFDSLEDSEYKFVDIVLVVDNNKQGTKLNLNKKIHIEKIYKTNVQDIKWVPGKFSYKPKLIIRPIQIDDDTIISNITLDNLDILHKLEVSKGSNIYFYINYLNAIIICDSQGNIIE